MLIIFRTVLASLTVVLLCLYWMARHMEVLRRFEHGFRRLASRRRAAVLLVFLASLLLRLAALPLVPFEAPHVHDEFSYLLAAETFASGRLTNPPHPMWVHFETFHVLQQPTYMSMYPPAQGIMLALGKVTAGQYWVGVWISVALMCAAICWMMQGWLPPPWALLGGLVVALRFSICNYWSHTYWGGAVAALGGALLFGALPRILRRPQLRHALLLALGVGILANSRLYEGLAASLVVAGVLLWWLATRRGDERKTALLHFVLPTGAMLVVIAAAMMLYFDRVTGNPLVLPYVADAQQYGNSPLFPWQEARPAPHYRHAAMEFFYRVFSQQDRLEMIAHMGPGATTLQRLRWLWFRFADYWLFYIDLTLLPGWFMLHRMVRDRRTRLLLIALAVGAVALAISVWAQPHYAAPFTAVIYALTMQGLRHWRFGRGAGRARMLLVWSTPLLCLVWVSGAIAANHWEYFVQSDGVWVGPKASFGDTREKVVGLLQHTPGRHLVIVRYAPGHLIHQEWVYNPADIDGARVIFARDMGPQNEELLRYFHDRQIWLLQPDQQPIQLGPYPRN